MTKKLNCYLLQVLVALCFLIGLAACSGDEAEETPKNVITVPENEKKPSAPEIETPPVEKVEKVQPAEKKPPETVSNIDTVQAEFFILSPLWETHNGCEQLPWVSRWYHWYK